MNAQISTLSALPAAAWYCVRVPARREHVTARSLEQRAGVRVFSPRIRVQRRLAAAVTEALFPGYLFARFSYPHQARHVASTPGVLGLVSFGGPPPAVADRVIEHLETEVRRATVTPPAAGFAEGAWVRIVTGCFQGSEGRVLNPGFASSRVCVLLNLLGQEVQVSLPGDQLAPAVPSLPAGLQSGAVSGPSR